MARERISSSAGDSGSKEAKQSISMRSAEVSVNRDADEFQGKEAVVDTTKHHMGERYGNCWIICRGVDEGRVNCSLIIGHITKAIGIVSSSC